MPAGWCHLLCCRVFPGYTFLGSFCIGYGGDDGYIYIYLFFRTNLLSSFWKGRGHRCRPFYPPVLAFNFYRAYVQKIPLLVDFSSSVAIITHAVSLSASQFAHKKKSQRIFTSVPSAGLELTKLTHTRLEDNLIPHRDDRSYTIVLIYVSRFATDYTSCRAGNQNDVQGKENSRTISLSKYVYKNRTCMSFVETTVHVFHIL